SKLRDVLAVFNDGHSRIQTKVVARRRAATDWLLFLRTDLVELEQPCENRGRRLVRIGSGLRWYKNSRLHRRSRDDRLQRLVAKFPTVRTAGRACMLVVNLLDE